mmetsp:Transcript_32041/g.64704  ORF Transcript_32041/g.64704 Transcript_32041/m.64704 type:complete len:1997 (+) Transcript_32041:35-6025(+)
MDFLSSMLWTEASPNEDNDDEQNPAVLDFPLAFGDEKKEKKAKQTDEMHPYPASISIQMNVEHSSSSNYEQQRSPTTSPGDRGRGKKSSKKVKEKRQPNSPTRNDSTVVTKDGRSSELQMYYERGRTQFLCNHLAEAVDSYTHAIRAGLEEMANRKEKMERTTYQDKDASALGLTESIAHVHIDLAFALEIAGKYAEAAEELSNGRGMLKQTSHKNKDNRIRECMKNMERMERAVAVEDERKKQRSKMESALKKVDRCPSEEEKDSARKKVIGIMKQLLRVERDSLGEKSYAVAKLKLKIAKVRYEGDDLEGSLQDADVAIKTLRQILGGSHSLVGAACLFAATVNENLVSILSSTAVTDSKPLSRGMTPQCKSKIKRALEMYAEALESLKLKYSSGDKTKVQQELGDVFKRIGMLYGKEGSYMSAVDAYKNSLEVYGAAAAISKSGEFCQDAVTVWHNIGELHLIMNKFDDAVYAAKKCIELAEMVPKLSSSEDIVVLQISSFQIAGDAYAAMNRHDDATRSYQEALHAFRNARSNSRVKDYFSSIEEAKILRKIGTSLLHENETVEAKASLLNALKYLRSDKRGANSPELPMLLSNIGHAHIRCGEYTDAMKVLRSCLKCYADQGVSNRSPEVARAKQLYKEAQYGPDHHFECPDEAYALTQSPERSPQRTVTTQSTVPSSVYSTMSSGYSSATLNSVHCQLQKLLEQLQLTEDSNASLRLANGSNKPPTAEVNTSKLEQMEQKPYGQLDEVETLIKRLQSKVQPTVSAPEIRDIKRGQTLVSVDRGIASNDVSNSAEDIATLDAELQSVQKQLGASESSYQHMLEVVDETRNTHKIEKKKMEREIMWLRQQQNETAANGSTEELTFLRQEIHRLKELNKSSSEEVALIKATNSTLQAGNDAAMSEIDSLHDEIDRLNNEAHRTSTGSVAEMKKLEYELKQERSRRVILETSLEKEYENRGGGGGFSYHPMMPFGYPMQGGPDKNLKALEIDLATERANKEMLEDMVKDMTETHEQEASELSAQLSGMPNLVLQLEAHEKQNAVLSKELGETKREKESVQEQLNNMRHELSDVKGHFLQASCELSSLLEEKNALLDARNDDRNALEFTKKELANTLVSLTTAQADLKAEVEVSRTNAAAKVQLQEDHDCLKKEFKEAIALFQSEIEEAKRMRDEGESSYGRDVDRMRSEQEAKDKELDDTREHLKNVLDELEEAEDSRDALQTDLEKLEMALEKIRRELEQNTEELIKATAEVDVLRASCEEAESARSKLEESQAQQQAEHEKNIHELESSLRTAEKTIKELEDNQNNLQSSLSTNKKQATLALKVLKKVSITLGIVEVEENLNDDDDALLNFISSNIECVVEAKNKEVQAAAWNLSNTVNELDILEKKHRQLKDELTEISNLKAEHNDLLQEFKEMSKELLEVNVEKEEAQERCDLHKLRLKDAVDDLEELEYERDELKEELDQTFEDSARLERSLRDMIGALEDENERLQKYESATVDFDAVVWEKDQKLKQFKDELHAAHSQLTILRANATRNNKKSEEEIYPDILPETEDAIEEMAALRAVIHALEERNLELSEKLAKVEGQVNADTTKEETGFDGSELETLKLRVSELSELKENLEQELSKMRTYVDEVEMQRESDAIQEDMAALNQQVNELSQKLQESKEEVIAAANINDNDAEVIKSLQDSLANKDKQYMNEVAKFEEQVASLRDINSSLEDKLASTVRTNESKEMEQSPSSEELLREEILTLKAQIRGLQQENDRLSALLAESQAETIDASRTHADDQETIFDLKNALKEKEELLQSRSDHKETTDQDEMKKWITRVDTLENELSELKNHESECDECEQRNLQFANVMETLNDLQIENQGLKTEILIWETADDGGKGLGQKVNFEKEMNAAHKRFESMEKALQESINRLEKEKEKLVAAHDVEISSQIKEHDKTRIELSAWKLEMQNALNDIESLKRENDDLRNSFDAVSQANGSSSQSKVETASV